MRKELLYNLDKYADRPIVNLQDYFGINVLIDSGARFPVWTADEDSLKALGGIVYRQDIEYSGIGGKTKGNIYKIPNFIFGNKGSCLLYPQLPVVTNKDFSDAPFQMILSSTMFHNLEYTINDKSHTLTIRVPDDESDVRNAVIKLPDKGFQVLFVSDRV